MTCIPEVWCHPSPPAQVSLVSSELQPQMTNDQSWQWGNCHFFMVHLHVMHSSTHSETTRKTSAFIRECTPSGLLMWTWTIGQEICFGQFYGGLTGRLLQAGIVISAHATLKFLPLLWSPCLIFKGTVIFSYDSTVSVQNILSLVDWHDTK